MSTEPSPADSFAPPDDARPSRDRLIDAAAVLFHEEGYHHVSLDRVLREAGVVRSNFYYHFRSKEDLAVAVMDRWLEDLTESVIRPSLEDPDLPPLGRVWRILAALVEELECGGCRGGCPFGSLANAEAEHNERFRARIVEAFDGFARMFEGLYADAIAEGSLPSQLSAPQLAATTLAVVQGSYLLAKTYGDATPMRLAVGGLLGTLHASAPERESHPAP